MKKSVFSVCVLLALSPMTAHADGQGLPLNYDGISFVEEPIAVPIGPGTVNINTRLEQVAEYDFSEDEDEYNTGVTVNTSYEMQLPNDWQVGVQYFSEYDRLAVNDERDEYQDDLSFFVRDYWGTVAVGNVTGMVHTQARRSLGYGTAVLENDNFIGELDETGAYYSVRSNAYRLLATADQEGRAEAGLLYEQPVGKSVYFGSLRFRKGDTGENYIDEQNDTYGGALVGKYTYASFQANAQLGYETLEEQNDASDDHYFSSVGLIYKYGSYCVSAEGGLGSYDKQDRRAFALGGRVDIARGLSLNMGINYDFSEGGENLKSSTAMRYEF